MTTLEKLAELLSKWEDLLTHEVSGSSFLTEESLRTMLSELRAILAGAQEAVDTQELEAAFEAGNRFGQWYVTYTGPNKIPREAPPGLDDYVDAALAAPGVGLTPEEQLARIYFNSDGEEIGRDAAKKIMHGLRIDFHAVVNYAESMARPEGKGEAAALNYAIEKEG